MSRTTQRFTLAPGLKVMLKAVLASDVAEHLKLWQDEVDSGEIGAEARDAFVLFGYLSSHSDPRLTPVPEKPAPAGPDRVTRLEVSSPELPFTSGPGA